MWAALAVFILFTRHGASCFKVYVFKPKHCGYIIPSSHPQNLLIFTGWWCHFALVKSELTCPICWNISYFLWKKFKWECKNGCSGHSGTSACYQKWECFCFHVTQPLASLPVEHNWVLSNHVVAPVKWHLPGRGLELTAAAQIKWH